MLINCIFRNGILSSKGWKDEESDQGTEHIGITVSIKNIAKIRTLKLFSNSIKNGGYYSVLFYSSSLV